MNWENFTKKYLSIFFLISLIVLPQITSAKVFNRILKQGDRGDDVLLLQKVLNSFPELQVSSSGAGSKGNETNFFGGATKKAIIRLQNKYKTEILDPQGLSSGLGNVDFLTAKKLEDLYLVYSALNNDSDSSKATIVTSKLPHKIISDIGIPQKTNNPIIESVSKDHFNSGDTITITGKNFDSSNTVIISVENDKKYPSIRSSDGKTLEIQLSLAASSLINDTVSKQPVESQDFIKSWIMKNALFYGERPTGDGYIPTSIYIENKNGKSNPITVSIKI